VAPDRPPARRVRPAGGWRTGGTAAGQADSAGGDATVIVDVSSDGMRIHSTG
jgi:hypothetical protein